MEKDFWLGRWKRGETGWHQAEVEPALVAALGDLAPTRVLVPLCGKSLDLEWLRARGHEVVGVELSELACEAFFAENKLGFRRSSVGEFTVFEGQGIRILNGDFFKVEPAQLKGLGAVYDRAALIALPPEVRPRYAAHLTSLVRASATPAFRMLQVVLERDPHDVKGPPFSVPESELARLYGEHFKIQPLSREPIDMGKDETATTRECVYSLTLR